MSFIKTPVGAYCSNITNLIYADKLAEIFKVPAYTNAGDPSYTQIIKRPMDLGTIRKKLKDNSYLNIGEWKEDMLLVFNNAIEYNGANSVVGGVAIYLKDRFIKLCKRFHMFNKQNYEEELRRLYKELKSISEKQFNVSLVDADVLLPVYETRELEQKLASLHDFSEVEEIIKRHGYESMIKKGKTIINLDNLRRECLDDLWRYTTPPQCVK